MLLFLQDLIQFHHHLLLLVRLPQIRRLPLLLPLPVAPHQPMPLFSHIPSTPTLFNLPLLPPSLLSLRILQLIRTHPPF